MSSKVLQNIGSEENLQGFDDLENEDKERVRKCFEQGYVPECKKIEDKVGQPRTVSG